MSELPEVYINGKQFEPSWKCVLDAIDDMDKNSSSERFIPLLLKAGEDNSLTLAWTGEYGYLLGINLLGDDEEYYAVNKCADNSLVEVLIGGDFTQIPKCILIKKEFVIIGVKEFFYSKKRSENITWITRWTIQSS